MRHHLSAHSWRHDPCTTALAAIGALVVLRLLWSFLTSLYAFFLRGAKPLQRFGKWAIVTGASDGIGRAIALELAKKGMNIVLIARTQKKLDEVKKDIQERAPQVQVETFVVDFAQIEKPEVQDSIKELLNELQDVGVLFNNVGVSYDFPEYFDLLTDDKVQQMISVNVTSTVVMTKLVLPGMLQRRRGVIVNTSSGSGRLCVPLLTCYSAAKSYIEQFTLCLAQEHRDKNVHIQCHNPMFVTTKLAKIRHATFLVPSPSTYAKAAVRSLGYDTMISPYWPHALQVWVYQNAPLWLISKMALLTHLSLRKRGYKKLQEKKDQ